MPGTWGSGRSSPDAIDLSPHSSAHSEAIWAFISGYTGDKCPPATTKRGMARAEIPKKSVQGLHDHFGDSEKAVQGSHGRFTHCEKVAQVLHGRFTHCERAVQVLHSHFTHCERAVQVLHSHFTHCAGATHVLHTHFTHCDGLRKGGRREFTRLRRFTPKPLFARYDRDNSPPGAEARIHYTARESPPGHRSDLIGPLPLTPIFPEAEAIPIYIGIDRMGMADVRTPGRGSQKREDDIYYNRRMMTMTLKKMMAAGLLLLLVAACGGAK